MCYDVNCAGFDGSSISQVTLLISPFVSNNGGDYSQSRWLMDYSTLLKLSLYCFYVCVLNANINDNLGGYHVASLSKLIKIGTSSFTQAPFAENWTFLFCKVIQNNKV